MKRIRIYLDENGKILGVNDDFLFYWYSGDYYSSADWDCLDEFETKVLIGMNIEDAKKAWLGEPVTA